MTIVLVILAVLILLAVLFLIRRVNQVSNSILSAIMDRYCTIFNYLTTLEKNVTEQIDAVRTIINAHQEEVVRLTNKVEEGNNDCKSEIASLKHTITTLNDRITAPIDKINDTHNRVKTLGKGATSTDELRDIIVNAGAELAKKVVDDTVDKLTKKPKTTKKVTKEPVTEVIMK